MRILVETLRLWPHSKVEQCEADCNPRLPRRDFIRAYEFMHWCRKDAFRLQHLCRFLGSSEGRFTRLFRAAANATPVAFYNRMLLEQGCDLLRNPGLSVKEIAFLLGFKTSSHFVSAFHREFGMTPLEYRHGCEAGPLLIEQRHGESTVFKKP
jgi:AraC-like DNA-binding protein